MQANNQITFGIDSTAGNVFVIIGQVNLMFTPQDALKFMAGLSTLLAQHPVLAPKQEPQILIAGCLPKFQE